MSAPRCRLAVGLLVFCPVAAWAHALSPTYYPLAHFSLFLGVEWLPFFLVIPISIGVEGLVLWAWARHLGLLGNIRRAVCLYLAAKIGETAALYLFDLWGPLPMFRNAGWSSSTAENLIPLSIYLACGLAVAIPVAALLYRRQQIRSSVIVIGSCSASLAGFFSAAACSWILMMLRHAIGLVPDTVPAVIGEYLLASLGPLLIVAVLLAWLARRHWKNTPIH
ncbi:MAG: hypothetical protein GX456_10995 [Verrucomicrobia bacterium]|nr:hypothetical protein [Verrucomicrobiota bacterium]